MTSLKDGDLQHSSALAQSPKADIEPNHSSNLVRIRTADREVMVAPGGTAIPVRPVSRTETKITSQLKIQNCMNCCVRLFYSEILISWFRCVNLVSRTETRITTHP